MAGLIVMVEIDGSQKYRGIIEIRHISTGGQPPLF